MKSLIEVIQDAWGWVGLEPTEVMQVNLFGNLLVRDTSFAFWRICPEELSCEKIAETDHLYQQVIGTSEFQEDWAMAVMVREAAAKLGEPTAGRVYCLKIPGVLGGKYASENYGTITLEELISVSGNLALQIRDLPDGSKIQLKVVD